ncbi:MAG: SDR family NAD(P)-dependent oxidoreductase [Melioribacteraceae bacterium]|nr:SDR family NAD(P)-dependent oxidoreductase [Melioribacteraceae bacterium]
MKADKINYLNNLFNLNGKVTAKILSKFGRIDILVNAVGGNMPGATIGLCQTILDLKIEEFNKVTNLNFEGTVLPILVFGKKMADQKSGSIINISSMTTFRAITRVVGYSAAKSAVSDEWWLFLIINPFFQTDS